MPSGNFPILTKLSDQNLAQTSGPTPTNAAPGREFKERAGFNRRRGAMRRRVHQVNTFGVDKPL